MIWKLARRNTARNVRRSTLTLATDALGCTLLIVGLSWINGLFGSIIDKHVQQYGHLSIRTKEYAKKQHTYPLDAHLTGVEMTAMAIEKLDGVTSAHPIIRQPATMEVDQQIGDVFGLLIGQM